MDPTQESILHLGGTKLIRLVSFGRYSQHTSGPWFVGGERTLGGPGRELRDHRQSRLGIAS